MDKEGADPERVKNELASKGVIPDDWGGDTQFVNVSALTGQGVEDLLNAIMLQAEVMELTAVPDGPGRGVVIESRLDRGRGPVATVLVQNGTLRQGSVLIAGEYIGRVRAMVNDRGEQVTEAGPSMPVEVLGLSGTPDAGDPFSVAPDERKARELADFRQNTQHRTAPCAASGDEDREHVRHDAGRREVGAASGAQDRRARLARSDHACDSRTRHQRSQSADHRIGRRRHQRVGRDAGADVARDDFRLQRPGRCRRRRRSSSARTRRALLQRDLRTARRHQAGAVGHVGAGNPRGNPGPRRSARRIPFAALRSGRRLYGRRRHDLSGTRRSACCATTS